MNQDHSSSYIHLLNKVVISVHFTTQFSMLWWFWQKNHPQNGLFYIILWTCVFCKCFGLCPFSVQYYDFKQKLSKVRVTIFDWLWLCPIILMHALQNIFSVIRCMNELPNTFIDFFEIYFVVFFGSTMILVAIFMDMKNREDIWNMVNIFNEFDEKVNQIYFLNVFLYLLHRNKIFR